MLDLNRIFHCHIKYNLFNSKATLAKNSYNLITIYKDGKTEQVKINKDYLFLFKFWEDPKTYVNESANPQSGLVVYTPTTNFQNEMKYIFFLFFSKGCF